MKKLIFSLLLMVSFVGFSAPQYSTYKQLLQSRTYVENVKYISSRVANQILLAQPTPTTPQEIARYNYAHDILNADWNSKVIFHIASFVCNENYLTDLNNYNQIEYEIENSIINNFDILGSIY